MEPLGEIAVADSRFLGFCFRCRTTTEVEECEQKLKQQYPDAAHVPIVYKLPNGADGWNEDGEPPNSVGPGVLQVIEECWNDGFVAVAVVRYWKEQLLGVTCGRLQQCYQSIARLALHRYGTQEKIQPLSYEVLEVKNSVYGLAAGDCELILDVVQDPEGTLLDKVRNELNFGGFKGAAGEILPRLQNLQADLSENLVPVYRYPGNYSGDEWETFEWKPISLEIKKAVEENLLLPQTMNHCVTNYYRDGKDFIDHHSDKDLDLNREGVIVSVSLGDERVLELKRRSEPKDVTRIVLPARSMLVLGPKTNKEFSHSVLQKPESGKPRISLTMRDVKTFKDLNTGRLFGQGVSSKSLTQLRARHLVENGVLFSGFFGLSALMVSKTKAKSTSPTMGFAISGIFAASSISIRLLMNYWYKQHEEAEARDFFSKASLSGTKY
eukprot:scaffold894_cov153-Cylindrotheca_fusiformis.AAC.21